ncbi:MAG: N-acetylmuramoyl-L-alanine amidase [Patescibacteria group bacterium]
MKNKNQILLLGTFPLLFGALMLMLFLNPVVAEKSKTIAGEINLEINQQTSLSLNSDSNYISPLTEADFEFNALGLQWEGDIPDNSNIEFYLKTENTDWIRLDMVQGESKDLSELNAKTSFPISVTGTKAAYKISGGPHNISNVKILYLDTTKGPSQRWTNSLANVDAKEKEKSGFNIISREEWGANEDYRFWKPQYETPKKFVIHHTASSNGGDDPAATIRAIYYWHAVVLGWGDIGYNYLIDGQGNVYKGRYGGNGVIGGHVYNEFKGINYNEGTVGVAILGCYDEKDGSCYNLNNYNTKIQKSLTTLLAKKANKLKIKPGGNSTLIDMTTPNIIAHQDLDYTQCPGNIILGQLDNIRKKTKKKYLNYKDNWKGKISANNMRNAYKSGWTQKVTVTYTNTGSRTWHRKKTYLKVYNNDPDNKTSKFSHKSWDDVYGKFRFNEKKVLPGEEATFTFKVEAPKKAGNYQSALKVYINKNYVRKTRSLINTRVDQIK